MLLNNLGLKGQSLVEELYENQAPFVEAFFDREEAETVPGKGCVHVTRQEVAVVDVLQHPWATSLGTSGLDCSVALFLAAPGKSRVGIAHIDSVVSAGPVAIALAREVNEGAALDETKTSKTLKGDDSGGLTPPSSRRRGGPLLEAHIVGGFQDSHGVTESILGELLRSMAASEFRYKLELVCAGLMNDSSHNGNEEDKRGPRCALVTACCMRLGKTPSKRLDLQAIPVNRFADRGPALALRLARSLFRAEPARGRGTKRSRSSATGGGPGLQADPARTVRLGETADPAAFWALRAETDSFRVDPFVWAPMDKQSAAILFRRAVQSPAELAATLSLQPLSPANLGRFAVDACAAIRVLLADPDGSKTFAAGALTIRMGDKGAWEPSPPGATVVVAEDDLSAAAPLHPHALLRQFGPNLQTYKK